MWVRSLGWEDPLEEGWQPTPVFLPGESHGQRSLVGYSPWGCKELDTTKMTEHLCYPPFRSYGFQLMCNALWYSSRIRGNLK